MKELLDWLEEELTILKNDTYNYGGFYEGRETQILETINKIKELNKKNAKLICK